MGKVIFFENEVTSKLNNRKRLKNFLDELFIKEGKKLHHLTIVFCNDDYLLQINKQALQHDYFTDIITFDLSDNPNSVTAELYISTDRVLENAATFQTKYAAELHRVIFHGCLHLCGFKDKSKKQQLEIREKEDFYLEKYFS